MVAAIGLIADPTVRSTEAKTGTDAAWGVTTIGGGVGVAGPADGVLPAGDGGEEAVDPGLADGVGDGEGLARGATAQSAAHAATRATAGAAPLGNLCFGSVPYGRSQ